MHECPVYYEAAMGVVRANPGITYEAAVDRVLSAGADPTLEFLARIRDRSKWAVRENVPIFEPHKRGEVTVTESDLHDIAAAKLTLETGRGVVGRVTGGHTIRPRADGNGNEPVYPPPTLFGFQVGPRVGTYGPKQLPAILVDWLLYPEHAATVDRLPYRSVEYQHSTRVIRGTAVMLNDPFLDMGIAAFSATGWGGRATSLPGSAVPWWHERALAHMNREAAAGRTFTYEASVRAVRGY